MGRGLVLPSQNNLEFRVTGVMEDVPSRSHIHFDFLASYITLKGRFGSGESDYFLGPRNFSDNVTAVYIRLAAPAAAPPSRPRWRPCSTGTSRRRRTNKGAWPR